jgi:protein involved in polysaccharide export with SLBB domain
MEIPFLGSVSVQGRNYRELRRDVIDQLRRTAPPSYYIDFVLKLPATFDVFVFGAVSQPGNRPATSLTRLLEFIASTGGFADGASKRRVTLTRNDVPTMYDIATYLREGDVAQNPFLLPGDRVFVPRMERVVTLEGAVGRPDTYEFLPGESLEDLLELAGGLLPVAQPDEITVMRLLDGGGYRIMRLEDRPLQDVVLESGDVVSIPSSFRSTERITVEGAVFGEKATAGQPQEIPSAPVRFTLPYQPGLTVLTVLENLGGPTPFAETERSYVVRTETGERIQLPDLARIWDSRDWSRDLPLQPGDYLVIPMENTQVYVGGSVNAPQALPYVAGLTVADYVKLAGGIDPLTGSRSKIYVVDDEGNRRPVGLNEIVRPGQVIYADTNTWTNTERFITRTLVVTSFVTAVIELTQLIMSFSDSF